MEARVGLIDIEDAQVAVWSEEHQRVGLRSGSRPARRTKIATPGTPRSWSRSRCWGRRASAARVFSFTLVGGTREREGGPAVVICQGDSVLSNPPLSARARWTIGRAWNLFLERAVGAQDERDPSPREPRGRIGTAQQPALVYPAPCDLFRIGHGAFLPRELGCLRCGRRAL